ncbi:uncharacterized protein [Nicotiana tomentosiformis]|uniref:uncharacterized protein n=1 Tax=Nicotiana tomentosiformis TaxID=4098 RepID=UPI00388CE67B
MGTWTNLFKGNRSAANSMTLSYIPPQLVDGQPVVQLEEEEVAPEEEKWRCALIALYHCFILSLICIAIFYVGPYTINNRSIILKPWTPEFDFSKEFPTNIPLWVKFPNLTMSCWSSKSLSRISSVLGTPLYADECTTKQTRISYARMLIEVNVSRTLPEEITVIDPKGRKFQHHVTYDWKPMFCDKCQIVGHSCQIRAKPPVPQ